ncbi:GGDEF domain-containing protein [Hyphococcus luteus]|uniref:diguanylate cyclase n=1 Tax=Hyphococcus luteus TaxID=2058213 RepID=A0A2S7K8S5_9PROT|nr:GGDEF domain-containing protein [Marinicaulis flavus]PQA88906.1 hypothetical protein CW354_02810 [Marinicaulis flavus]
MSPSYWKTRSLRYWIALGMIVALVPLVLSSIAGYWFLNHGVIDAFHDVSMRERKQVAVSQNLRILIWDTLVPVDEYVEEGDPALASSYRDFSSRIETDFAVLHENLGADEEALTMAERARADWTVADRLARDLLAGRPDADPLTQEKFERFHAAIQASSDRLGALYARVAAAIEADHRSAMIYRERVMWLMGIAGLLSLIAMVGGVFIIGRVMSNSVDRLVEGAQHFAEGDRNHRISVKVPPELRRVALEFNRMIFRIDETETALAELARRDGLTKLLNRRAFDEALEEVYARVRRGEDGALMMLDIDHFKQVNDVYGHGAGDDVLRAVARIMTSTVRPFDHVYRVGGEEFSILLPGVSMAAAVETAERLRASVAEEPVDAKDGEEKLSITVSIGVAEISAGLAPAESVEAADAALYHAKARGRNRVVSIDSGGMTAPGEDCETISFAKARDARR